MNSYSRRKQYVEVFVTFEIEGSMVPRSITMAGGRSYEIERVKTAHSISTGQPGKSAMRFPVVIRNQETSLFFDGMRWYVEMKESVNPR